MAALYVAASVLAVAALTAAVIAWIYGDSAWRTER
jgi:hypothetical protein